ncbi:RrF2 family transcriptional regulator [Streptomyces europaeiscabiei]|uniref:Rrf2 family transcriptional regulator n=1 Tax=Streptomyces europaeiscabiei TaxID=146819 RepID=A0ABU4N8Z6_9ACTN|nr:Rrf2 family transcriptional regulator [Streptomyces europaeiscabiei]MDX3545215.1 Rrf2 family transcriptional regulator [Streptomyces europaeiscabiei]MDX3554206.1 Rrf2 family transcriptional regulator [Streptomyces europaeiscabiei]MDX3699543.1 Rrf2 family transcriptional regulator [Streptomyces europaeiscabiei]MDX3711500.1 Rrf2 family transcriptional regulator [Streptomyces europaeiscabiei]MDX3838025.1 Rrf2 family transcriptional regulator [Streptomyces europaeiscabiei]
MRISARADYAVRAVLEVAVRQDNGPVKAEAIATVQEIPHKFLEGILGDLRRGGLVTSRRGGSGGYLLAREPSAITVADVIRAVDGPIVSVRGERPTGLTYTGSAEPLLPLWIALRANVRRILEGVTVADLAAGALPEPVKGLAAEPTAWENP